MFDFYYNNKIKATDAKFEAQRIAFAPLAFQAARALRDLGILQAADEAGIQGISAEELSQKCALSLYGVGVLAEMGLGMGVLKLSKSPEGSPLRYTLGKVGFFLLQDEMTRVNMDFVEDVCYAGSDSLTLSIKNGKPEGLSVFGNWKTVYEALSQLPPQVQKSWFAFDHFYSDIAFPEALPIVFRKQRKKLFDLGGNTAKWALACCRYSPTVHVTIVDLPGQTAVAEQNIQNAGLSSRISIRATDILDPSSRFPTGADAVWMSQFLDCFSLEEISGILFKIGDSVPFDTDVFVLEPLWDMQRFEASAYSLQATSLYFTCIANGNSKMYRFQELVKAVEDGGFELKEANHNLGINSYSLLRFRKKLHVA